jgi:hypothetical protein
MTDKLAELIRGVKDKHEQDPVAYGSWCNADCCGPWPCDAIRAVEVVEDLKETAFQDYGSGLQCRACWQGVDDTPPHLSHCWLAAFLARAEEKLAR